MANVSRFLQLLSTGLFTGIYFGDRMGVTPIRPKLPPSSFVLFQQELHLTLVTLMPVLIITSLLSGVISLIFLRRYYKSSEFIFTAIATICVLAVVILTRTVNVPINEVMMTWSATAPPQNVMELWSPWEKAHTIRTILAIIAFASLILATLPRRPNTA